jgi:GTP-binding protein HflX
LQQLKHIASRLVRGWTHLERQRGGGIGNRGPGETQLETDRRLLGKRVKTLTARLEKIKQQRETGRQQRAEIPVPSLASRGLHQRRQIDAVSRAHGRRRLCRRPIVRDSRSHRAQHRVARATPRSSWPTPSASSVSCRMSSWLHSNRRSPRHAKRRCLLHVVDVSDPRRDEHIDEVNRVLDEIGAADLPQVLVFNKIDRIGVPPRIERDEAGRVSHVWLSAAESRGLDGLRDSVAERLARVARLATLRLPVSAGELRARLYASNLVLAERIAEDGAFEIDTRLSEFELLKWAREPGVEVVTLAHDSPCTAAGAYLQSSPALRSS